LSPIVFVFVSNKVALKLEIDGLNLIFS
jgi:hypothetical protein